MNEMKHTVVLGRYNTTFTAACSNIAS